MMLSALSAPALRVSESIILSAPPAESMILCVCFWPPVRDGLL
jgi:hypothetical protein